MNPVIIFDVSSDLESIREIIISKGYYASWSNKNKKYNLPLNTLWRQNFPLENGITDIQSAIKIFNENSGKEVKLLRCIVLNCTPWEAIEGEKIQ